MAPQTIVELFWDRTGGTPTKSALRYKHDGAWTDISWAEYGSHVKAAAKGLLSLGFSAGDKMSLLSKNRPTWHIADMACLSIGGATAPVYTTNSPEQVAYIVAHSDSKVAVVEDMDQLEKVLKMQAELPKLEKVVVIAGYDGSADASLVMSWDDLLAAGKEVPDGTFDDARAGVGPSDLATFVYTSGTTGPPKAVMLTHANIWFTCESGRRMIAPADPANSRTISYLPLSHIAERMISHFLHIYYGSQTWFAESLDTLMNDLKEVKPTYFFAVPRVWEKFYAGIQGKLAAADPKDRKVKLALSAIAAGREVAKHEQAAVSAGKRLADAKVPLGLKLKHRVLDKLVLTKLREAIGLEQCELPLSAAAPLNPELIWFFHSIGVRIAEGYGQSEDNGPTTWNPIESVKIGSVGVPMPGVEVKIAADGEILARGENVSPGYYKDDVATAELIDSEGWMHSGDVGELDEHNYLKITDRKKDLIITAGGKNIAPQELENRIKFHELISQVVVIGDRRPFLTALITLDEEKAPSWGAARGIEGNLAAIAGHELTLKELEVWMDSINEKLAKVEGIKKFRVLERDFRQEDNEITPTLKVK
ncbi:MAG: AMP-binding protein, partial [Actinobacteria bacterium]|nr:AMP-binding protein [Actinomycetota bacterium]